MKRPDFPLAMAVLAIACSSPDTALSQIPLQTPAGGMVLFKSSAASRVVEKVRSEAQGVMVDVSVKVGDPVGKGQLLGHLELDATQLQLDLARHAMESKGNVEAARYQAEAWAVAREETEEAVRKREMKESRLSWAAAMEQMYQSNHETQLEAEKTQVIQYEYWKQQYEKRFLRAPVAGIVSEVVVEPGKAVNFATHVFTISNDDDYMISVPVPAPLAATAVAGDTLPVRSVDGKSVSRAKVDGVTDDPRTTGGKILRLLVHASDFPALIRAKLKGMKFDVLLPEAIANTH
jgi:multidrug efflux pump subunit AcrA (membrane-fusion protein)